MAESLLLPVSYNGAEFQFEMQMIAWTYTHRFKVDVLGDVFYFEPDEEGEYRAIADATAGMSQDRVGLLKQIGATLSTLMQQ